MLKQFINKGLVLLLLLPSLVAAQDVSVKASMDSVAMLIGHQTKLTLEMTKPKDADISFPLVLDTLMDKVEVLKRSAIDTTFVGNDREHLTQDFVITSFDSGFYYIPPFEFEIQANSGGGVINTNPLALKIYTYQIDSIQGLFDLKPVKKIPLTFKEVLPFLKWGGLALVLILLGLWAYLRFKREGAVFVHKEEPKEPPYILAFRELERIRDEKLWQKGKEKIFYTDLTDTLRTYIDGRFQVVGMEQTSDEILKDIKGKLEKDDYKKLESTLKLADLVKFAKLTPLMDESEQCIKDAYAFVDHTKPSLIEDEDEDKSEEDEPNDEVVNKEKPAEV